jgi:hypothetical protein
MAENLSLPAFPSFDIETDKANAGPLWGKWVERLEDLFICLGIEDADRKRELLLHYAGERVCTKSMTLRKRTLRQHSKLRKRF